MTDEKRSRGIAEWAEILWDEASCGDYDNFKEMLREAIEEAIAAHTPKND